MEGLGLAFTAMFSWGGRHPELLHEKLGRAAHRRAMMQFGLGSVVYLFTIALAFVSAPAALIAHFAVAVFYIVDRTAAPGADEAEDSPGLSTS